MQETICQAIRDKRLLMVHHNKGGRTFQRVVEPYLLFTTKADNLVLHSWQVEGQFDETAPPGWCNLSLSGLSKVTPLERFYDQPQPGYNPQSPQFHRVLCHVPLKMVRI